MSIWNKILVGFILVGAVVFFVLGARALKTHQYWRTIAGNLEESLKAEQELHVVLADGSEGPDGSMGLREAKSELHALMVDRGRVWRNCERQRVQTGGAQGVTLSLATDLPDPHGIPVKAVIYIFDEKGVEEGGRYLGEYIVTAVGDKSLQLVPSMELNAREIQRLQNSEGPWSLYEIMPIDQHEILASMEEEEIRAMFPEATVDEYVADREAVEAVDPNGEKAGRDLRHYEVLYGEYHKARSMWTDEMAGVKRDLDYLGTALADAKQQVQFRQDEIDALGLELTEETRQQGTVAAHRQAVETKLAEVRTNVDELIEENLNLAGQIARIQLEATRRINERTRRMAQASTGL